MSVQAQYPKNKRLKRTFDHCNTFLARGDNDFFCFCFRFSLFDLQSKGAECIHYMLRRRPLDDNIVTFFVQW